MTDAPLRERLHALADRTDDSDWLDVRRRARRPRRRRVALRAAATAVLVATAAPAWGLVRDGLPFLGRETAPDQVKLGFAQLDVAAPAGMAPQAIASQTRKVTTFQLRDGSRVVLYVSPTKAGGYCQEFRPGGGGCQATREPPHPLPLPAEGEKRSFVIGASYGIPGRLVEGSSWERIEGGVLDSRATRVSIEFQDGRSVDAPLVAVSEPIDAAFFLYETTERERTPHHRPSFLTAFDRDGSVLARQAVPDPPDPLDFLDPQTGRPGRAVAAQERKLIEVTTGEGHLIALWSAPSTRGGECHWLTRDGGPGSGGGCPPAEMKRSPLEVSLSGGDEPILEGHVGPEVTSMALQFEDGDIAVLKPVEGYFLYAIPLRHYAPGARPDAVVARDALGHEVDRRVVSTAGGAYPCDHPVPLGAGLEGCR